MGCPPAHFYGYQYIGKESSSSTSEYTTFKYDENTELKIACRFYYEFVGEKKEGVLVNIWVKSKERLEK